MKFPNYYEVLGVKDSATPDEIKKAYRKLARKYHPDVSKEADAARHMAAVNEANEVLSDPEKRSAYDAVGHQAWAQGARSADDVRPPPGWSSGFERPETGSHRAAHGFGSAGDAQYSEFFEELFGRAARERSRQNARHQGGPQSWPGDDQHADITLTLDDAYHGCERSIQLQSHELDGSGHVQPRVRTLSVKVPPGVGQGQRIRLARQGGPGFGGGAAGDLFLKVHIAADARCRIEGHDLTMKVFVAPWEAALGGDIEVETPAGRLTVVVPSGSVSGRKLRLKGKGIPGKTPGDLYLELEIAIPGAVTDEQKNAWRNLAAAYPGFSPRAR